MAHRIFCSLLFSVVFLLAPSFVTAQSNTGYSFSSAQLCTLDDAGQVDCVLSQGYGRLRPPSSIPPLTAITTGEAHACGITLDGQPVCWGGNFFGQLDIPSIEGSLVQIDAGANHTCALESNGEAICWGINTNLQLEPPEGATFTQVDAAGVMSCGLLTDGEVVCWSDDPRRSPQDLTGPFVKIDIRSGAVCGLTADGRIQCSDPSSVNPPIMPITPTITPPDNGPYIDIATSSNAVCGLQSDGALDCAIRNPEEPNDFPLGDRFVSIQSNETDILIRARAVVDGVLSSNIDGTAMCGERLDGTLQCWDLGQIFPGPNSVATTNAELVASLEFDLDARIYGPNAVEIFWTPLPFNSLGTNTLVEPIVEIFRNGELIARKLAKFSYFDPRAVVDADYQIRLIDEAGNPGPLSGILSVNTDERTVLFEGEPTLMRSQLENLPDVFTNTTVGDIGVGIVIGWKVNPEIEALIDRYEIRVNGASVGFTRSQLFVDIVTPPDGRCVEVIAVGFDESRLGVRAFGRGCN